MSAPITPPIEPMKEPQRPSRQDVLNEYWWDFFAAQLQDMEKRKKSGWGVHKGMLTEAEFWDFMLNNYRDVIEDILERSDHAN